MLEWCCVVVANTMGEGSELGEPLWGLAEAGLKPSATTTALSEAAAAFPLLLRLAARQPTLEERLGPYWTLLAKSSLSRLSI